MDRTATVDGMDPPLSGGGTTEAPAPLPAPMKVAATTHDVAATTHGTQSPRATNAAGEEHDAGAVAPPSPVSTGVEAAPGEVVVTAPAAEPSVPEASPPAIAVPSPPLVPETTPEAEPADRAVAPESSTSITDTGSVSATPLTSTEGTDGSPARADTATAGVIDGVDAAGVAEGTQDIPAASGSPAPAVQTDVAAVLSTTDAPVATTEITETAPAVSEEAVTAPVSHETETLAPGTVVAGRYTIAEQVDEGGDERTYRAADARSYERCWSCGSAQNGPANRFCQNCGAPIQNHPVVLAQTAAPTGAPGEVEHAGLYLHVQAERRPFGVEGVGIEIGAHSAEGPHHPNEDSYWYTTRTLSANSGRHSVAVALLADGMGGYAPGSGLISSRIAATAGASIAGALDAREDEALGSDEAEAIARAGIAAANDMALAEIARSGEMGATLVGAVVHGDTAYVANIGDSRAYYVDPRGQATRITRDQSLVAQELGQGSLSEEDIYSAPGNNIILHAVGEEHVETAADWYAQPLEPDSLLILCSDGYWKTMRGTVIPEGVSRESATLTDVARRMVDDALARGSDDNTTVLLIAIS